jgi:hypothetical protein
LEPLKAGRVDASINPERAIAFLTGAPPSAKVTSITLLSHS